MEEQGNRRAALLMNGGDMDVMLAKFAQMTQQLERMQRDIRDDAPRAGARMDELQDNFEYAVIGDDDEFRLIIRPLMTACFKPMLAACFNSLWFKNAPVRAFQDVLDVLLISAPSSHVLDALLQVLVDFAKKPSSTSSGFQALVDYAKKPSSTSSGTTGDGMRSSTNDASIIRDGSSSNDASIIRDVLARWKPSTRSQSLRHLDDDDDVGLNLVRFCCERNVSQHIIKRVIYLFWDSKKIFHSPLRNEKIFLHAVCQSGGDRVDVVRHLLDEDNLWVIMKQAAPTNMLPIHYACHAGNVRIVKLLHSSYQRACQVADAQGRVALHVALEKAVPAANSSSPSSAHFDIVRFLICHSPRGCLPLHYACKCAASLDIVTLLVAKDPRCLSVTDNTGRRPLHYVCMGMAGQQRRLGGRNENNVQQLLRFFLQQDPMASCRADHDGCVPLHLACTNPATSLEHIQVLLGQHHHDAQPRQHHDAQPRQDVAVQPLAAAFFVLLKRNNRGKLPLHIAQRNLPEHILTYLAQQQDAAIRAIHQAYRDATENELRFLPDSIVPIIWQFAQPDTTDWWPWL